MNKREALEVLSAELARWRELPWKVLKERIEDSPKTGWPRSRVFTETAEILGTSGTRYELEFQLFWDDRSEMVVRVIGAISDGGWRSLVPLTDGFLMRPDGCFVGESDL